jgi:molybdopterin-guanine dinucleotide biosynthesis protein A
MSGQQADAAVVVTGDEVQRQRHPVFLLLKTELRRSLEQYLESGRRKVDDWLAGIHCVEVMFEDEAAFMNLNTPEDIQALAKITGSRPASG